MFSAIDSLHDLKKTGLGLLEPIHVGCGAHPTAPDAGALPETGCWRTNRERQRPRWLRSACHRAEEDLGVPEKAFQNKGVSLPTNSTNFHELGAASAEIFAFGFIRVHSVNSWFKNVQRLDIQARKHPAGAPFAKKSRPSIKPHATGTTSTPPWRPCATRWRPASGRVARLPPPAPADLQWSHA